MSRNLFRAPTRLSSPKSAGLILFAAAIVILQGAAVLAQGPIPTPIPKGPQQIELLPVASGFTSPVLMTPLDANRELILDQPGRMRLMKNGMLETTPFLDVSARIMTLNNGTGLNPNFDERGLLGVAVDPNFFTAGHAGFGRIFTYTSEAAGGNTPHFTQPMGTGPSVVNHHSVLASWKVDPSNPDLIDPASRFEVMRFEEPQGNHNGGHIEFGPDGMLHISTGDGGGANDNNANGHHPTAGNGQYTETVLGKILRIDVNGTGVGGRYGIPSGNMFPGGTGGLAEIHSIGWRNPYRFSFNGNQLLVADVGQLQIEELSVAVAGGNFGWRYKEGTFYFDPANPTNVSATPFPHIPVPPGLIDPILQYDHDEGIAIVGGFVYDGSAIPELQGKYVFGDYSRVGNMPQGRLFYADLTTGEIREFIIGATDRPLGLFLKGMGIDASGELYAMGTTIGGPQGTTGVVYRIVPIPEPSALMLMCAGAAMLMIRRRK